MPDMEDNTRPDWRELCRQAAVEKDSEKLLELARQIEQALAERERRLRERKCNGEVRH